jgi:hypothetical protein
VGEGEGGRGHRFVMRSSASTSSSRSCASS